MFENRALVDLAVGRSSVRQRILALLIDESSGRLHLREIQRRVATSPGTASRELARLVAAGLIEREAEGSQVYFRASASPLAAMLRSLLVAMPAPALEPRPARLPRAARPDRTPGVGPSSYGAAEPARTAATVEPAGTEATSLARPIDEVAAQAPARSAPPKPAPAPADPLALEIAGRFAAAIRPVYGDSLRGVYLFGARARGGAPSDADVETIVVLDGVEHYGAELERTSQICASLSHEADLVVSRIFVTEAVWNGAEAGIPPGVRSEALAL